MRRGGKPNSLLPDGRPLFDRGCGGTPHFLARGRRPSSRQFQPATERSAAQAPFSGDPSARRAVGPEEDGVEGGLRGTSTVGPLPVGTMGYPKKGRAPPGGWDARVPRIEASNRKSGSRHPGIVQGQSFLLLLFLLLPRRGRQHP